MQRQQKELNVIID